MPASKNPQRTSSYDLGLLNLEGLSFPMTMKQIPRFEAQNAASVNVFALTGGVLVPARVTAERSKPMHVNLLQYKKHFYFVKNLSRLLRGRLYHRRHQKKFFCQYCLCAFASKGKLRAHTEACLREGQRFEMPPPRTMLKFKDFQKCVEVPFVLYCDFEALNQRVHMHSSRCILKKTRHIPASFCAMRVSTHSLYNTKPYMYRGKNCMKQFLLYLRQQADEITNILSKKQREMIWDAEARSRAKSQTSCYLCGEVFKRGQTTYRDHCHLSGRFRGMSCLVCNLKHSSLHQLKIPVIMHNGAKYDLHFLIENLHTVNEEFSVIPKNTEQYLALQLGSFIFIDSFQHLGESLAVLADNLRDKGKECFVHTREHFPDPEQQELLLQKGVFCYSYLDDFERFLEKQLPTREKFFNDIGQKHISEGEYAHAQKVWERFSCQTLGQYHDIYLLCDVLMLSDIFQNFRQFSLKEYGLDPAHFLTGPQFSYAALLKMTGINLELLSDIDMHQMIERGVRGGYCGTVQRFAKANNQYMPSFDPTRESSYLLYVDKNSLYAYVMQHFALPTHGFRWLSAAEIERLDPCKLKANSKVGYILEVSLRYPPHLQRERSHQDYPLACEKLRLTDELLSPLTRSLKAKFRMKSTRNVEKLVPNFFEKERYVVHYRNLGLYLELGLQLEKIHRVVAFYQSAWMAPYINFNIEQRQKAKSEFEISLFKKMNNSVFGKTFENVRRRRVVKLVTRPPQLERLSSRPTFRSAHVIHEHLAAIQMAKPIVRLDKPIYLGFSILDLSKLEMYSFHYRYMAGKYGTRARLLYTDTDSFIYWIHTEDLYEDLSTDGQHFDFSNYPTTHPLFSNTNRKVPGKMKDEAGGAIVSEFVALRSKMYSLKYDASPVNIKKAKGIGRSAVASMRHNDYVDCLFENKQMRHSFHAIRSYRHRLYTIRQTKLSLSAFDDKRFFLNCGIHSHPYGDRRLLKRKATGDYGACHQCSPAKRMRK